MTNCNRVCTPLEAGAELRQLADSDPDDSKSIACSSIEHGQYQSLVGSLIYLMTSTRPNLAYMLSTLSKFTAAPTLKHLAGAKQVLRYLSQTQNLGLTYAGTSGDDQAVGYCDTNWAGDRDDCKSTGGYVFPLQSAAISSKARKQIIVALSSTKTEYINCSEAMRGAIWLQRL